MPRTLVPSAALAALPLLLLTACSPIVALQPAEDAVNVGCAEVIVGLPQTVAGLDARETNAQGTAAWGDPARVILRCGVAPPPPTAEYPCVSPEGVDWLRNDTDAPNFVFTTYGRDPAVEVIVDSEAASGLAALTDLGYAVSIIPQDGECIAIEDAQ